MARILYVFTVEPLLLDSLGGVTIVSRIIENLNNRQSKHNRLKWSWES